MNKKKLAGAIAMALMAFVPSVFGAGFLEMPEITEVPELERKSLLKDMDIPPVRQRDPDPQGGPRLNVTEFRLEGIVEYPELGITRAEIAKLIEGIRFEMMEEGKKLPSGFTEREIGELSDLIVKMEEELGERHAGPLEVQRLVWLVRSQRAKRGLTLGMIETVADKITQYYREHGFILAKAFIPEQKVRDGVVSLTLLLGKLGEVRVQNNQMYTTNKIAGVFSDMLEQPVTGAATEERLYLLNDYPGLRVTGFFEPGSQVGDTRLNVNVNSEDRLGYSVRLDNHGSDQTGQYRLFGELVWNNPFGNADQFQLGMLYARDPGSSTFGRLRYKTKFFSPRLDFSAGVATNDFVLGPSESEAIDVLELEGGTRQRDVEFQYALKRSRTDSSYVALRGEQVESIVRIGSLPEIGNFGFDDKVRNYTLSYRFDSLKEAARTLHQGEFRVTSGKFLYGQEEGQDPNYRVYSGDYTAMSFWKIPWLEWETRFILNGFLQYASGPLSSINRAILGGPSRVKAYSLNAFSADDAAYVGGSLVFNGPKFLLDGHVQPLVFADAAHGRVRSLIEGEEDEKATLVDAGVGLQLTSYGGFRGNLLVAFPMRASLSAGTEEDEKKLDRGVQAVFDIQYVW